MRSCMRVLGANQWPRRQNRRDRRVSVDGTRPSKTTLPLTVQPRTIATFGRRPGPEPNNWCTSGAPMVHMRLPDVFAMPVEGSNKLVC
jgi:hypothetical protein